MIKNWDTAAGIGHHLGGDTVAGEVFMFFTEGDWHVKQIGVFEIAVDLRLARKRENLNFFNIFEHVGPDMFATAFHRDSDRGMLALKDNRPFKQSAQVAFVSHMEKSHEIDPQTARLCRVLIRGQLVQPICDDLIIARAVAARIFTSQRLGNNEAAMRVEPGAAHGRFTQGSSSSAGCGVGEIVVQTNEEREREFASNGVRLGKIQTGVWNGMNGAHAPALKKFFYSTPKSRG